MTKLLPELAGGTDVPDDEIEILEREPQTGTVDGEIIEEATPDQAEASAKRLRESRLPTYRRRRVTRQKALEALEDIQVFMMDGNQLDDALRERINRVLSDHSNRLKALISAVIRVRSEQLAVLIQDVDAATEEVALRFHQGRDDTNLMPTHQLLEIVKVLTMREKLLSDFLTDASKLPSPDKIDKPGEKILERLKSLGIDAVPTPAARRNVTSVVDQIVKDAARRGAERKKNEPESS